MSYDGTPNYRVWLERRARGVAPPAGIRWFGRRNYRREDVEAESASEAKRKAEEEHDGWRAVEARKAKPRRRG